MKCNTVKAFGLLMNSSPQFDFHIGVDVRYWQYKVLYLYVKTIKITMYMRNSELQLTEIITAGCSVLAIDIDRCFLIYRAVGCEVKFFKIKNQQIS